MAASTDTLRPDEVPPKPVKCLIALGSNLGDRLQHLRDGVRGLALDPKIAIRDISSIYETAPVGGPDQQGPYLNAVLSADVSCSARALLSVLHEIEAHNGRTREIRWGPRTLDLDLLVYGDLVHQDDSLTVPHPRMLERGFVLWPACDVWPDDTHPVSGKPLREHLAALTEAPEALRKVAVTWFQE